MTQRKLPPSRAKSFLSFCLLTTASMVCVRSAMADTVWMDNGDKLTGTILSVDGGTLLLSTTYGGNVSLQMAHVQTLQTTSNLVVQDKTMQHEYLAKLAPGKAKGTVVVQGIDEQAKAKSENQATAQKQANAAPPVDTTVALSTVDTMVKPNDTWGAIGVKGKVDLGLVQETASTDTQNYNADFNVVVRKDRWRNTLTGQYIRDKSADVVSAYTYTASDAVDYFISDKYYWEAMGSYQRDFVNDVSRQSQYGTGPGYQFWDDQLGAFSMAVLASRMNYAYRNGDTSSDYAATLNWNYNRYLYARKLEAFTTGTISKPVNAAGFSMDGTVGLQYNFNNWLSAYVKYERDQVSASQGSLNQSIYSTGLGLTWQ